MSPVTTRSASTPAKPASPAPAALANVASLNPDNMIQGGLMDDFDGEIIKARFAPWDYNGNLDHHILAAAITIQPEEGDEFTQHYSASDLEQFVPSNDGVTGVDLANGEGDALEGVYAMRVGKKEGLNNNSNFAQFLGAMLDAGYDRANLSGDIRFLEGVYGHFNRIPQKKRSGIVSNKPADAKQRVSEILVITELKNKPAGAAAAARPAARPAAVAQQAAPAQQAAAAQPAATATNGDLDATLHALIVPALATAGDEGLAKKALGPLVLKGLPGNLKAKGVKRVVEAGFLEAETAPFLYDPESGTLYQNAE